MCVFVTANPILIATGPRWLLRALISAVCFVLLLGAGTGHRGYRPPALWRRRDDFPAAVHALCRAAPCIPPGPPDTVVQEAPDRLIKGVVITMDGAACRFRSSLGPRVTDTELDLCDDRSLARAVTCGD